MNGIRRRNGVPCLAELGLQQGLLIAVARKIALPGRSFYILDFNKNARSMISSYGFDSNVRAAVHVQRP
jgi:hypothetical protein